jgi:hypothetical protein
MKETFKIQFFSWSNASSIPIHQFDRTKLINNFQLYKSMGWGWITPVEKQAEEEALAAE